MSAQTPSDSARTPEPTRLYRITRTLPSGYTCSVVLYSVALFQTYTYFNVYPGDPYAPGTVAELTAGIDSFYDFYARPLVSLNANYVVSATAGVLSTAIFTIGLVTRTRKHTDPTFADSPMKVIVGTCQDIAAFTSIFSCTFVAYFTAPTSPYFPSAKDLQLIFPGVKPFFDQILTWSLVYGGAVTVVQLLYLAVSVLGGGKAVTPTPTIKALERELAEERAKCAKLEQECQKAKAEADASTEAKGKLEDETRGAKELLAAQKKEIDRIHESIRELEEEIQAQEKLLTERTTELDAAQSFLTKVDTVSEADVLRMVENLNTLISSTSGALSDTWDQREPVSETNVEGSDLGQIRDCFGDLVFEQVAVRNPVAVTLAIEMYLVQFIERVTSGWGSGDAAETLGEIYRRIPTKEGQAVAAGWRTLTKRYLPQHETPRDEEIIGDLARILMITRSFSDFSEAKEAVGNDAGTEVKAIIEATLQLDDTIKTKIAWSHMSVYIALPGATFNKETMVDEFEGEGAKGDGGGPKIVAGTMEIGLLRRKDDEEKVLRNPKIILERDLPDPEAEGEK